MVTGGRSPLADEPPGQEQEPAADSERLRRILGGPDLSWLVDRARARIARGAPLGGVVTLTSATPAQRRAVSRLLGRPVGHGTSLSVPLPAVESALQSAGLAADLRGAVESLTGPVPDRAAEQAQFTERREAARAAAMTSRHADQAWLRPGWPSCPPTARSPG